MTGTQTEDIVTSSYTITITPDDTGNPSATLRVNLGQAGARITEMTVRAGDAEGFLPDELPGFDLSRLMRAITPAPSAPVIEGAGSGEPAHVVPTSDTSPAGQAATGEAIALPAKKATRPRRAAIRKATPGKATPGKATPGKATPARSAPAKAAAKSVKSAAKPATKAAGKTAAKAARGTTARGATGTAGKPATAKRTTAKRAAATRSATARTGAGASRRSVAKATEAATQGRAYRRMPADFVEVFQQAGGVTAVADHYSVPRHTAQGWVRRLRQEGSLPASR
jgi:hypothetical protein